MPLGEYIPSSLKSSHLKSGKQSPYSFLRPSRSNCCLLLHRLNLPKASPLVKQWGPPMPHAFLPVVPPCLKWRVFLPPHPFPESPHTKSPPPSSSEKTFLGNLPQCPQAGNIHPSPSPCACHPHCYNSKERDLLCSSLYLPVQGVSIQ